MEAFVPLAGQSAGLIDDMGPAAEIVADLVREAEGAHRKACALLPRPTGG